MRGKTMSISSELSDLKTKTDLSIEVYLNLSPQEYVTKRVAAKIKGYSTAAKLQRRWYLLTSIAAIISSATVPVLVNLGKATNGGIDPVLVTTIISLIVTILVSVEKLFRFREHWRSYDTVAAALHYEQLLFQTKSGVYSKRGATQKQLFPLFVKRFEGLILDEKNMRISMETDQPKGKE
jgi:Protein of unknown function (DUF4231)